jgi:hypothetical protein
MRATVSSRRMAGYKMTRMIIASLLSVILVAGAGDQAAPAGPVKIFVFTAAQQAGSSDSTFKGRSDSVKDLQAVLRRKAGIEITDSRDQAAVVVEVLERGDEDTGEVVVTTSASPVTGTPHVDTSEQKKGVLRLKLTSGGDTINLQGTGAGGGKWRTAATNAAAVVDQWIKDHRASISQ